MFSPKAAWFIGRGDFLAAIDVLKTQLRTEQETPSVYYEIAQCYDWLDNATEAEMYALRAVALDEYDFESLRLLTRLSIQRGDRGRALEFARKGVDAYDILRSSSPPEPLLLRAGLRLLSYLPLPRRVRGNLASVRSIDATNEAWAKWAREFLEKEGFGDP